MPEERERSLLLVFAEEHRVGEKVSIAARTVAATTAIDETMPARKTMAHITKTAGRVEAIKSTP